MKTIDDVLNHPENQVDPIISKSIKDAVKMFTSTGSIGDSYMEKLHTSQLEYNIAMHKLQIEMAKAKQESI